VPTEQWQDFQRQAERVDGGERVEVEALCRRKDGSPIHILSVTLPVSASGNRSVVFGLYRDITQRKTAEIALQGMSARLIEVQEAERKHLARELHDEIGQLLTGLRLMLRTAGHTRTGSLPDRLEEARGIVDDLLSRVRALSFDLRPADLDLLGLLPALLSLFERYTQQTGIQVNFKHEGIERRFPPAVETGAYRIVQEALTNAARHAGVAGVTVHAFATRRSLKLQIADRGCGFDRDLALKSSRSSGLAGMKERISLLNGSLIVESSPGHGATITAEAPLPTQNEDVPKP
jgi:signal transduction histidine kinase